MHEGFVNFNAGTLGASMVEGRISAGVVVGDGSDIGGGASIMGTLSGGGTAVISIGERCLLGANAGLGISLGDDCVVEAGLYVTAGSRVTLPDGEVVKAARAERRRRPAVPPQLPDGRDRGAAAQRELGRPERGAARQRLDALPAARPRRDRGGRDHARVPALAAPDGARRRHAADGRRPAGDRRGRPDRPEAITRADARRAGFADPAAALAALRGGRRRCTGSPSTLAGPDPRIALRAPTPRSARRAREAIAACGSRGSTARAATGRGRRRRCGRSPSAPAIRAARPRRGARARAAAVQDATCASSRRSG